MKDPFQTPVPRGWKQISVREAGSIQLGRQRAPKHHAGANMRPYLRVANVFEARIDTRSVYEMNFTPEEFETFKLSVGDILLNEGQSKELVGRPAIYKGEVPGACFTNSLIRFKPTGEISPEWALLSFRLYMHSGVFQNIARWTTNIAHLSANRLADLPFRVPPRREQADLTAEVATQESRIDAGVAALTRVQANLKRYRASVLKAACEGRLVPTEAELARRESRDYEPASVLLQRILKERRRHWEATELAKLKAKGKPPADDRWKAKYKGPEPPDTTALSRLPEGWCWTTIDAIANLTIGFAFRSTGFVDEGVRLLRGENIEPGRLRWLDTKYWPAADGAAYENLLVNEGDVILAMDRPVVSAGLKLAQATKSDVPCLLVQRVARLRLLEGDNRLLFMSMSDDRFIQHVVVGGQTGTQLPHVSGSRIANYPIALPPRAEQERLIGEAQRRLSTAEHTDATVAANLARADRVRQSLLQAAFEGKLGSRLPGPSHTQANPTLEARSRRTTVGGGEEIPYA